MHNNMTLNYTSKLNLLVRHKLTELKIFKSNIKQDSRFYITTRDCSAGLEAASCSGTPSGMPSQQLLSTLNSSQGSMPASLHHITAIMITHMAMITMLAK